MSTPEKSRSKGSVIQRHGAFYWRRRQHGRDLPLERLGSVAELRSKRAAEAERDRRLLERNPLAITQGTSTTVAELANLFNQLRIEVSMKSSGGRSARSRIFKHIVPHIGALELMRVDALVVQRLIKTLTDKQLSRQTIDNVLANLSTMLDFGRQSGFPAPRLDRKLLRLPPRNLEAEQRCFTPGESMQIIQASEYPWRAAWALCAFLGIRCGEVLGLRWTDVDFNRRIVCIRQNAVAKVLQTVKSKNSRADLPIPQPLYDELKAYEAWLDTQHLTAELLFADHGCAYSGNQARHALSLVLQQLNLKHGGLHAFRHGTVTLLLNAGVPIHEVRAIARHGRIETTQRYSHAQADGLRRALDAGAGALMRGNKGGTNPACSPGNS